MSKSENINGVPLQFFNGRAEAESIDHEMVEHISVEFSESSVRSMKGFYADTNDLELGGKCSAFTTGRFGGGVYIYCDGVFGTGGVVFRPQDAIGIGMALIRLGREKIGHRPTE